MQCACHATEFDLTGVSRPILLCADSTDCHQRRCEDGIEFPADECLQCHDEVGARE